MDITLCRCSSSGRSFFFMAFHSWPSWIIRLTQWSSLGPRGKNASCFWFRTVVMLPMVFDFYSILVNQLSHSNVDWTSLTHGVAFEGELLPLIPLSAFVLQGPVVESPGTWAFCIHARSSNEAGKRRIRTFTVEVKRPGVFSEQYTHWKAILSRFQIDRNSSQVKLVRNGSGDPWLLGNGYGSTACKGSYSKEKCRTSLSSRMSGIIVLEVETKSHPSIIIFNGVVR
jgi:hypothetical protein